MKAAFSGILLGLGLLLFSGRSKPAPLSLEAYVWQQVQTEAVGKGVTRAGPVLDGFGLHSADVSFRGSEAKVTRFDQPWQALAGTGKRVGMVIRIPYAEGGLGSSPRQAAAIAELIRSLIEAGEQAGVRYSEVQIDYDCPDSKIELYGQFLSALAASSRDLPIAFTALPSWLRSPHFPALARTTNRYVLQVHSLELPKRDDSEVVICDVDKARAALAAAGKIGVPFRLALPTYRCIVLLDREGKRVDVISEGSMPAVADAVRMVAGSANAQELASLVADLKAHHSPLLTGLIWYRLPVDTDRMNWSWPTFLAVSAGRKPASRLEITLAAQPEGFARLEIQNSGEQSERLPRSITIRWQSGTLEAADGLNGYRVEAHPEQRYCEFTLEKDALFELPPSKSIPAGWIRLRDGAAVEILRK